MTGDTRVVGPTTEWLNRTLGTTFAGGGADGETGSGSLVRSVSPTITGGLTVTASTATALTVGRNGTTTPILTVDASAANAAAGIGITGAAAGGTVGISVTDSAAAANLAIDAKGTGTIALGATSTGSITLTRATLAPAGLTVFGATAIAAGAATNFAVKFSSTANFGIFWGSGAPSFACQQGSLFVRSDGSSTSTRLYVQNSAGTWTNVTTAA